MDTVVAGKKVTAQLVEKVLVAYLHRNYANADIQNEAVFDQENNRFLIMSLGWQGIKRIHSTLVHVDVVDGKLWIQCDNTEHGVARDFLNEGVPKEDVVLGFKVPQDRKFIDFAI